MCEIPWQSYTILKNLWMITVTERLKNSLWLIAVDKLQGQAYLLSSEAAANDSVEMWRLPKNNAWMNSSEAQQIRGVHGKASLSIQTAASSK